MSVEQMFENLGYTKRNDCTNPSYFKKDDPYAWINFNNKSVAISSQRELGYESLDYELIKAIQKQCKELGWLEEEKQEIKQETNYEHYKDGIIELCVDDLAISKGKVVECGAISCSECDFADKNGNCIGSHEIINWLKQPYKNPTYKLTKFENDLLQSYLKGCLSKRTFKSVLTLNVMKEKGYFKGVDENATIKDILADCEVIKDVNG